MFSDISFKLGIVSLPSREMYHTAVFRDMSAQNIEEVKKFKADKAKKQRLY